MADQQLIGALEAGGTKMVCATGYADGTVLEREQIATTTPQETVEAVNAWFADKGIAALGIGAFGPTAVNPASPQYGKILETPKTAWRYFDLLGTIQNELNIPAGPGVKKRWGGKSAGEMTDDLEAMDLLAGYLAQALMTYILCYAPQKIVIGGGVADHTPIVPLARKKCAEMLNGYIVTPEMADIDNYIVNNSLEGKQGIMGCLALGAKAL